MSKYNQQGSVLFLVLFVITLVFFLGTAGFAAWAYMERQDYKDNVDQKVDAAVAIAEEQTATEKDNEFIEREKQPLKDYRSPAQLGSILIKYPKTWSAYVDETGRGSSSLDGYFNPNFVPGIQSDSAYALRVQLLDRPYSDEVRTFDSNVRQGRVTAQPYEAVNVPGVVGIRFDGEVVPRKQGVMILLPLRDKTIKIYTESDQYKDDFENNILQNLTFQP